MRSITSARWRWARAAVFLCNCTETLCARKKTRRVTLLFLLHGEEQHSVAGNGESLSDIAHFILGRPVRNRRERANTHAQSKLTDGREA